MVLWVNCADRAASLFDRKGHHEICETNPMVLWTDYIDSAGMAMDRCSHAVDETNPMAVWGEFIVCADVAWSSRAKARL